MEYCQNVAYMREAHPEAAVPQHVPVQQKAVPMSSHQAEETRKVEVPLSLFIKAKFAEFLAELAGCTDLTKNTLSGEGLP